MWLKAQLLFRVACVDRPIVEGMVEIAGSVGAVGIPEIADDKLYLFVGHQSTIEPLKWLTLLDRCGYEVISPAPST